MQLAVDKIPTVGWWKSRSRCVIIHSKKELMSMKFADKLIHLRKKHAISQEELADKLDVSRQSVSKWESGLSMPELSKILQLADMFQVSTDYLLKDDIDINTSTVTKTTVNNEECTTKRFTQQQAEQYISNSKRQAKLYVIATALCILSPAPLMILLANNAIRPFSPTVSIILGLVGLFVLVFLGVGLFIYSNYKDREYGFIDEHNISLDSTTKKYVQDTKSLYYKFHIRNIIIGSVLCILSAIPVILFALLMIDYVGIGVCISLVMVIVAVSFFIYSGTIMSTFNKLLNTGEYSANNRKTNKILEKVATIYWTFVTAMYLMYSFISNDWGRSWIFWPVSAVLYAVVVSITEILIDKKVNKSIVIKDKTNDKVVVIKNKTNDTKEQDDLEKDS